MSNPLPFSKATCSMCLQPIEFIDGYWRHLSDYQPRHPATPTALPDGTSATLGPLRLAYAGASTVESADGATVAECRTAEIAAALVNAVNGVRE